MNWASDFAYVMLDTYKHHHTESHFIFTIFVSMSRHRSIYVVSMWSFFSFFIFIFIMINRIIPQIQTHLFVCFFLEYTLLFLDDNVDEECELISNSKSSASEYCLGFAWFFANFSLVLLIKMFLIKKKRVDQWERLNSRNHFVLYITQIRVYNEYLLRLRIFYIHSHHIRRYFFDALAWLISWLYHCIKYRNFT